MKSFGQKKNSDQSDLGAVFSIAGVLDYPV